MRNAAFWTFCAPRGGGTDAATRLSITTQRIRDMAVILEESSFGFQCVPASDGVVGIHLHALGLRLVARPLHADGVSAGLHTKADDRRRAHLGPLDDHGPERIPIHRDEAELSG